MNKTYKIQLPKNKEAQNIKTSIKDGTIEVEVELKEKWEPRDGEICYVKACSSFIAAIRSKEHDNLYAYAIFSISTNSINSPRINIVCSIADIREIRPSTDSEKQLLFDALAKDGKMWDAEKKQVVDLPKPQAEVKECPTLEKDIDWEERRYEIARQIMDSQLSCCGYERSMIEPAVKFSVECTDALIAELKKGGER